MAPGDRHSLRVETGGHPVVEIGPVHVVLGVFLAGPHHLHRTVNLHGDLNRAGDAVDLEPAAKPAADQMIVDHDLVQGQARGFCRRLLRSRDDLGADPDFAAVLADMNRAVHRLHRSVGEKWNLVDRLDLRGGARHRLVDVADILRHGPRFERRLFELGRDVVGAELGVRALVPFDDKGGEPFPCCAHVVGHDRDRVVELDDLTHALERHGRSGIHALHPTAKDRRLRKRRDLHSRRAERRCRTRPFR